MMEKQRVGICVRKKAIELFRSAWIAMNLNPDKVFKGDDGRYYIVWDHIVWDRTQNPRTKPFFDIMACLDQIDIRIERARTKEVVPYMHHLLPQAKIEYQNKKKIFTDLPDEEYLSFYLEEHCEDYLYACIVLGAVAVRGYSDLDFACHGGLPIPSSAVPVFLDEIY